MNEQDPYRTLAFEICRLAADDYLRYRKMELSNRHISTEGKWNYSSAKAFITSPYFDWLSGIDGKRLMRMLEDECYEWIVEKKKEAI